MIPRVNAAELFDPNAKGHADAVHAAALGASDIGFLVVHNTPIPAHQVSDMIETYRTFFHLPSAQKAPYDMARTGSNRGWGASGSERVNPDANPDYKQVFDCGTTLPAGDPVADLGLLTYAPNIWPDQPEGFADRLRQYYDDSTDFALDLLCAILAAVGEDATFFRDKFARPMALLRGNYYPERPKDAGENDFGIATHTDYGCLTLLATDGSPGLEVRKRGGGWIPVSAKPGEFVINFGEMLDLWTQGRIVATPHRVVGTSAERISIPLFFNPSHDVNVAPKGQEPITAVEHLEARYKETYVHLTTG